MFFHHGAHGINVFCGLAQINAGKVTGYRLRVTVFKVTGKKSPPWRTGVNYGGGGQRRWTRAFHHNDTTTQRLFGLGSSRKLLRRARGNIPSVLAVISVMVSRFSSGGGGGGGASNFRRSRIKLGYGLQVTGYSHFRTSPRQDAKMAKLGGQGCQVRKVEKSLDGSGYYSSVPRGPSCNKGGVAAAAARSGDR